MLPDQCMSRLLSYATMWCAADFVDRGASEHHRAVFAPNTADGHRATDVRLGCSTSEQPHLLERYFANLTSES